MADRQSPNPIRLGRSKSPSLLSPSSTTRRDVPRPPSNGDKKSMVLQQSHAVFIKDSTYESYPSHMLLQELSSPSNRHENLNKSSMNGSFAFATSQISANGAIRLPIAPRDDLVTFKFIKTDINGRKIIDEQKKRLSPFSKQQIQEIDAVSKMGSRVMDSRISKLVETRVQLNGKQADQSAKISYLEKRISELHEEKAEISLKNKELLNKLSSKNQNLLHRANITISQSSNLLDREQRAEEYEIVSVNDRNISGSEDRDYSTVKEDYSHEMKELHNQKQQLQRQLEEIKILQSGDPQYVSDLEYRVKELVDSKTTLEAQTLRLKNEINTLKQSLLGKNHPLTAPQGSELEKAYHKIRQMEAQIVRYREQNVNHRQLDTAIAESALINIEMINSMEEKIRQLETSKPSGDQRSNQIISELRMELIDQGQKRRKAEEQVVKLRERLSLSQDIVQGCQTQINNLKTNLNTKNVAVEEATILNKQLTRQKNDLAKKITELQQQLDSAITSQKSTESLLIQSDAGQQKAKSSVDQQCEKCAELLKTIFKLNNQLMKR